MTEHAPGLRMTRKLVRDPAELIFEDGKRYATQRWITTTDDWRKINPIGWVNFGSVHVGQPFPTDDSVRSQFYVPPIAAAPVLLAQGPLDRARRLMASVFGRDPETEKKR
jgi:hypothetical protein